MKLGERLRKRLDKKYEPSKLVAFRFGRYDVAIKTDLEGNPILAFVGKANEHGMIKGDQFNRHLVKNAQGVVIKDHWDYKGNV
ncbi:hypothetical protein [Spirosoma aerolatum]|uniref:hypothetical protein n=1 Tax=Spirosoma aerolatum TaxID=1211326 RepID=UPI0009ADD216|nr:hypothetical protein [Spirosoma aerolatum]